MNIPYTKLMTTYGVITKITVPSVIRLGSSFTATLSGANVYTNYNSVFSGYNWILGNLTDGTIVGKANTPYTRTPTARGRYFIIAQNSQGPRVATNTVNTASVYVI